MNTTLNKASYYQGKPVVHYAHSELVKLGSPALVWPVDHPSIKITNTTCVITSAVVKHDIKTGIFETQHTIYKPVEVGNA